MENLWSPLRLLADVAVDQMELSKICIEKRFEKPSTVTETELGLVKGEPLDLLMASSGKEFTSPGGFVQRKKENPTNNVDYEVNRKRKLCAVFETQNQQTEKHKNNTYQNCYWTRNFASGSKLKFNESYVNPSANIVSKHGTLPSWKIKRRRSPKTGSSSGAVLKGSGNSWEKKSTGQRNDGLQTKLPMPFKTKIQDLDKGVENGQKLCRLEQKNNTYQSYFWTSSSASHSKLKFNESCLHSSADIASEDEILISWKLKRRRPPRTGFSKKQSSCGAVLKGSEKS